MHHRRLGRQGLTAGAIGYGTLGTAAGYGPSDENASIAAIRRAFELGVTLFDTAVSYGWGEGEQLLSRAIHPFRSEVSIATKFGFASPDWILDSRPERIRSVVRQSLTRLGTETIDVLYQHRSDPQVPIEDVVGTMSEFVLEGSVRFLGLCEIDEQTLRRAHAVHPISVVQSEYSLFARDAEALFPVLDDLGVGFVAYSPLARGFLTEAVQPRDAYAVDDMRRQIGWWEPGNFERNLAVVGDLRRFAEARGVRIAQLALAWLLSRRPDLVPIPGTRNLARVEENTLATHVAFSREEFDHLDQLIRDAPFGARGA